MPLSLVSQKAHDISHAIFRVAALVKNNALRLELENAAVNLLVCLPLVSSAHSETENSMKIENWNLKIGPLKSLLQFSVSINEIKPINAQVLERELHNLQTAIDVHIQTAKAITLEAAKEKEIDIEIMFAKPAPSARPTVPPIQTAQTIGGVHNLKAATVSDISPKPQITIKPTTTPPQPSLSQDPISSRQERILNLIRDIAFCRLRNIMEVLPDVSERTIRNDIQVLIDKKLVRRIGGGGPNSYFETLELTVRSINSPSLRN